MEKRKIDIYNINHELIKTVEIEFNDILDFSRKINEIMIVEPFYTWAKAEDRELLQTVYEDLEQRKRERVKEEHEKIIKEQVEMIQKAMKKRTPKDKEFVERRLKKLVKQEKKYGNDYWKKQLEIYQIAKIKEGIKIDI